MRWRFLTRFQILLEIFTEGRSVIQLIGKTSMRISPSFVNNKEFVIHRTRNEGVDSPVINKSHRQLEPSSIHVTITAWQNLNLNGIDFQLFFEEVHKLKVIAGATTLHESLE